MAKYTKDLWNRDKDGNRKEQRSFLRYAIVATVVFLLFMFLKKDNLVNWVQAGITLRRQQRQIELYRQETGIQNWKNVPEKYWNLALDEFGL